MDNQTEIGEALRHKRDPVLQQEMEKKLAIDYLMYKGFNLEDIINKKAKTTATKTLRQKITKNEETVKSARKRSTRKKSFDLDNLDLNI